MPSTYKATTYAAAALWQESSKVRYKPNPKRGKSFHRYASYEKAKTVGEALALGSKPEDLLFDYEHGLLEVSAPLRKEPIDIYKYKNFEELTYTDTALARFTVMVNPARKRIPSEKIMGMLKDRLKRLSTLRKGMHRLCVARAYGVEDVNDLGEAKGFWENGETYARRSVADKEAEDILAVAANQKRNITDYEVLRVLRLWGFRKNETRKNVMREGQTFVLSDTLGLTTDRTGHVLKREESALYPGFNKLMCRWLTDNLPPEVAESFSFTSININKNYNGRMHRDSNNVGPSILRAFGDFTGGRLNYWPEDDKALPIPILGKMRQLQVKLDVSAGTLLFDGRRAHEVDDFKGERYSLVYFTCARFWKCSATDRAKLIGFGFRFPKQNSVTKLRSLLRPPQGYKAKAKGKSASEKVKARARVQAPYFFWPIAQDKAKQENERAANKYWAKRPPRKVKEEGEKPDGRGSLSWIPRKRRDREGWYEGNAICLGPKLTKLRGLELKGYNNVVDAAAALNAGGANIPKAITKAGYCATWSIRTRVYYVLYLDGKRDAAIRAFGVPSDAKQRKLGRTAHRGDD